MITMHVRNGRAIMPDDCIHISAYDPPVGTIIKFIAEEGDEYFVVTSNPPAVTSPSACHGCVFNRDTGHPLSKIFRNNCDANVIRVRCYNRIYKPIDTILEDL